MNSKKSKTEGRCKRPLERFVIPPTFGMDYSIPETYVIIYDGMGGFQLVGGGVPTPEEQEKIFAKAKGQKKEYEEHRDKMLRREFEYYEKLWEIDHPFWAGWEKFKKWLRAV